MPPLTVSSALYLQSLLLNFRLGPFVFEAGRAAARVAAQARLGRAFQSIENRLYYEQCQAVTHPGHSRTLSLPHKPPRTRRQAKSASQCSHKAFQFVWAAWRNPRTGTFLASDRRQFQQFPVGLSHRCVKTNFMRWTLDRKRHS